MALLRLLALAAASSLFTTSVISGYVLLERWLQTRQLASIPSPDDDVLVSGRKGMPSKEQMKAWALEYGELFRIRIGWYDYVVINSPEAFKELMDKQSISTSSKIPAPIGHGLVTKGLRIFTMGYGPQWRSQRSIMHRLLSPKQTLEFVVSQEFEVKHLLYQLAFENDDEASFFEHIRRMSMSIVTTSTYGRRIDSNEDAYMKAAAEASAMLGGITRPGVFPEDDLPPLSRFLPEFLQPSRRKAEKYADVILRGKLASWTKLKQDAVAGVAPPSFGLELLQSEYDEGRVSDEEAAWLTGGLVDAGAEITSVVLQNLILFLAATPEAQAEAHRELDRVVGRDRAPSFADMQNLPYVRACVKEILRLCPVPTWALKHFTDSEVVYKNHRIPKGTVLMVNTSFMHWDPARYNEPHRFEPKRFIDHDKSSAAYAVASDPRERDHFTFGGGRRICPAIRMAENTLCIVAANVLWAFEIRPPSVKQEDGSVAEGTIDTSPEAFMPTAFAGPKPFKTRFMPRSQPQMGLVKKDWDSARVNSYELRGKRVQLAHS